METKGQVIGMVTSGAREHTADTSLGFAQVEPDFAMPSTKVQIVILRERHDAVVGPAPIGRAATRSIPRQRN